MSRPEKQVLVNVIVEFFVNCVNSDLLYELSVLQDDKFIKYTNNKPIIKFKLETTSNSDYMSDVINIIGIGNNKGIKSIKIN